MKCLRWPWALNKKNHSYFGSNTAFLNYFLVVILFLGNPRPLRILLCSFRSSLKKIGKTKRGPWDQTVMRHWALIIMSRVINYLALSCEGEPPWM